MIRCMNCKYFGTCKDASPEITECAFYEKSRKEIKYVEKEKENEYIQKVN